MPLIGSTNGEKKTLRIAVDIGTLSDGPHGNENSGIQVAVIALLNQLQRLDTFNEYFLFETRKSAYTVYNEKWKKILLPAYGVPAIVWLQSVFPRYLSKYNIDVLWAPKGICPLWFSKKIRVYTTIHDLSYLHFPETLLYKDRIQCQLLIPQSAKRSAAVFTVSGYIKRDIEQNLQPIEIPVLAIPHGKPDWTIPLAYSSEKRKDFLFFAGNLEPRKNLINAVRALEILHTQGIAVELQIAYPSGWKNIKIINYIKESPIQKNIKLLGFLSVDELKEKYLTCKALLYPSFYEGFGLPVLEALVSDCPVITSQNTVMQEIAEDSALYFNPFDPRDIADKIRFVYSDAFDREFYLKHKNRILEKYSWETAAIKMLSVFVSSGDVVPPGKIY